MNPDRERAGWRGDKGESTDRRTGGGRAGSLATGGAAGKDAKLLEHGRLLHREVGHFFLSRPLEVPHLGGLLQPPVGPFGVGLRIYFFLVLGCHGAGVGGMSEHTTLNVFLSRDVLEDGQTVGVECGHHSLVFAQALAARHFRAVSVAYRAKDWEIVRLGDWVLR